VNAGRCFRCRRTAAAGLRAPAAAALASVLFMPAAWAHHGIGRYDRTGYVEFEGTLTGLDFVNPHSYVYFDRIGDDGETIAMSCEMRSATVLRRSGWSPDMFVPGVAIVITGRPHRDDPTACHVETLTLGETETLERYTQLTDTSPFDNTPRAARLATGEPNLNGDWAQEQYILATPPDGSPVGLVPISQHAAIEAGELPMHPGPPGWFPPPVTLTEAGRAAALAMRSRPTTADPRLSCQITSVLFDWVFDGAINRITQTQDTITMEYGAGLVRTVHLDISAHPDDITPTRAGHSIGHWDGDVLVVDTIGFAPGSLAGNVPHSDRLHLVERYTLNPATLELTREYVAEDPLYFEDQYIDADSVLPADAPFAVEGCKELAPEYRVSE